MEARNRKLELPSDADARAKEIRSVKAHFLDVLDKAQRLRKTEPVIDWVYREQRAMLDAVNDERGARGLVGITLGDLRRIESQALGHSDYASKFALYCAEVAIDPEWRP